MLLFCFFFPWPPLQKILFSGKIHIKTCLELRFKRQTQNKLMAVLSGRARILQWVLQWSGATGLVGSDWLSEATCHLGTGRPARAGERTSKLGGVLLGGVGWTRQRHASGKQSPRTPSGPFRMERPLSALLPSMYIHSPSWCWVSMGD